MTAPPALAPNPQPTGGLVSATDANQAASAIRRAGHAPTPGNVRMAMREAARRRDAIERSAMTAADWDALVRELPLGERRSRTAAKHGRDYRPRDDRGQLIGMPS